MSPTREDVAHTQSVARNLVGVGGSDALACGAHFVLALGSLVGGVEQSVGRHDEVCLFRNVESLAQGVPAALEVAGLVHKQVGSQHDAVADDVDFVSLEDTRGNGSQDVFLSFELKCVARVGTALEACYHVVSWGEHIDHLAFALIAPLEAEKHIYFVHVFSV